MKSLLLSLALMLGYSSTELPNKSLVDSYLQLLKRTMNGESTEQDVHNLAALYADGIIYEHPKVGIKLEGKETITKGMISFLSAYAGTAKDVTIEVKDEVYSSYVSTVQIHISFKSNSKEGVKVVERDQVLIFEFREGKISRVLDYW